MANHPSEAVKMTKRKPASDQKEQEKFSSMTPEERNNLYFRYGEEAWNLGWEIYTKEDGWKLEAGQDREVGCVFKQRFEGYGNIFRLELLVDTSPEKLCDELVLGIESAPNWTKTLLKCDRTNQIGDNTDICYSVTYAYGGGIVASRDFVNVRQWKRRGDTILSSGCYIWHPDYPPTKKYIRAENGPGGWLFQDVPNQPNKCVFMWLVNTDLKGWLPQKLIDSTLSTSLMEYAKDVLKHVAEMNATKS